MTSQLAEMAAKGKSPPYAARIQLGMLLQVPADPALDPAFITSQQAAYAAVEKPPEKSTMPVGKPPPSLMTASDRLESTA